MKEEDTLIREALYKVVTYLLPYIHNSSEASLKLTNYFIRNGKSPKDFASGSKPSFMGICLNNINLGEKAIIDLFKFIKMTKKMKLKKKAEVKEAKKEVKKVQSGENLQVRYDYPLVDGKPMSSDLKKKYRILMRKYLRKDALSMDQAQKKASKEILQFKNESPKKETKPSKEKEPKKKEVSKDKKNEEKKVIKKEVEKKPKVVKKKIREDED